MARQAQRARQAKRRRHQRQQPDIHIQHLDDPCPPYEKLAAGPVEEPIIKSPNLHLPPKEAEPAAEPVPVSPSDAPSSVRPLAKGDNGHFILAFTPVPLRVWDALFEPRLIRSSPIRCYVTDGRVGVVPYDFKSQVKSLLQHDIHTDRNIVQGAFEAFYTANTFEVPCHWLPHVLKEQTGVLVDGVTIKPKTFLRNLRVTIDQKTSREVSELAPHLAELLECEHLESVSIEFLAQMHPGMLDELGPFKKVWDKLGERLGEGLEMCFLQWLVEGDEGMVKRYKGHYVRHTAMEGSQRC